MYKVFTVANGTVTPGAEVEEFTFRNGEVKIPAILVGEEGRGRSLGVLPVSGAVAGDIIHAADIGTTRSGKPKLWSQQEGAATSKEKVIVVFKTHIGFRGSNTHTGDRSG